MRALVPSSSTRKDGKKAGVHEGAAKAFRSSKMDLAEAYNILGVTEETPWPEIVKVNSRERSRLDDERGRNRASESEMTLSLSRIEMLTMTPLPPSIVFLPPQPPAEV